MGGSFGDLLKKAGFEASPESDKAPEAAEPEAAPVEIAYASKMVVRRSRKGRGGKTVTRVTGLPGSSGAVDALMLELKRALGCGATRDGDDVLLQGALTERAAAWLGERLGTRVRIGN